MSDYADFFRATSPYIKAHWGKTFVIAISGEAIAHSNLANIVHDIGLLNTLGIKIVLIHGSRPQLTKRLKECDFEATFEQNRRITDIQTLACAKQAAGEIRFSLEALFSLGQTNSTTKESPLKIVSGNYVTAKPLGVRNGVDFHHTGEVRKIDHREINQQLSQNAIVLISPLGFSPTGEIFNLNLEELASHTSVALQADKLIMFTDHDGLNDANGKLFKLLSLPELNNQIGLVEPNQPLSFVLKSAYEACQNGVERCHLINFQKSDALIDELFTREGTGTLILKKYAETIRQATIEDVAAIMELIAPLEDQGFLVKRSRELLEAEISGFTVMLHPEGFLLACSALYPLGDDSAELACVAIHPDFQNQGVGARMLERIQELASSQKITKLFTLTTRATHWFLEKGFEDVPTAQLPAAKQALYNQQRNSKVLLKNLSTSPL